MSNRLSSLRCLMVLIGLISWDSPACSQIDGGYWPQWRGPNRDNHSVDQGIAQQWPDGGPPMAWQASGVGEGIAAVAVANGRVITVGYIDHAEFAIAVDELTGELIWARYLGPAVRENPLMRWLSQRSPTIDGDRVYIVRADGDLICLNATDGVETWRRNYPGDFGARPPMWGFCDYPLVDGDHLICTPGSPEAGMVALNKTNGETVWKARIPGNGQGIYSAVVGGNFGGVKQYLTYTDEGVFGVSAADGSILWKFDGIPIRLNALHTPTIIDDRVVLSSGYGGGISVVKIVNSDSGFSAEQVWRTMIRGNPFNESEILRENCLVSFPVRPDAICFALDDGRTLWTRANAARGNSGRTPYLRSALTSVDNRVVLRRADGLVRMIEVNEQDMREHGSFVLPNPTKAYGATVPVVTGGRLYIRDNDKLLCYDVTADQAITRDRKSRSVVLEISTGEVPDPGDSSTSVFVPTPNDIVDEMLKFSGVKENSILYDLGSGDGRVVIGAAKQYGCHAVGYEIDEDLVSQSRTAVKDSGLDGRVRIEQQNILYANIGDADIVYAYLLPDQLKAIVPHLNTLAPGTVIVTHQFKIPGVRDPDDSLTLVSKEDGNEHALYRWIAPLVQVK